MTYAAAACGPYVLLIRYTLWSLRCKDVQRGWLLHRAPRSDAASSAWPPKYTGCELILYSKEFLLPRDKKKDLKMSLEGTQRSVSS